jgi:hypothetical protein
MTIRASCPKGHTLTVEEKLAGKKIRCPRCQTVFQVPDLEEDEYDEEDEEEERVSAKPLRRARRRDDEDDDDDDDDEYEDEDDRPRSRGRRPAPVEYEDEEEDEEEEEMDWATRRKLDKRLKKKQLKLVDVGLLLHYIKLWMYAIGMAIGIAVFIMFVIAAARSAEVVGGPAVEPGGDFVLLGFGIFVILVFFLNLFVFLIGPLIGMVGSFLCCWVPPKSEIRGTIIISLTFDLISIVGWLLGVLAYAGIFGMEAHKTENLIFLLRCIDTFCMISAWLTFLTFLRGLGKYLGEPALGNEALNLIARLVVQVVSLFVNIATNIFVVILFGFIVAICIAIGSIILWTPFFIFAFYIRLIKLLGAMRQAIDNKL